MNMVAEGLRLSPGDHVIITDQEHHGGELCWRWLERRAGVKIDMVSIPPGEADPNAIVGRFRKAITPATKVISFSHILYSTGLRMPAAEICALARELGCLAVIDGAQAVGATPVDVKVLGCHFYATTGHKWLNGPKGTGLLYVSAEADKQLDAMALQSGGQANRRHAESRISPDCTALVRRSIIFRRPASSESSSIIWRSAASFGQAWPAFRRLNSRHRRTARWRPNCSHSAYPGSMRRNCAARLLPGIASMSAP